MKVANVLFAAGLALFHLLLRAVGQKACDPTYPGCQLWPAYPITNEEFLAMNGSQPAEWKAAYEENERSSYPYERSTAVEALLELKALVVEDPWGFTSGWLPQRHPCDFGGVICSRHGMVTGVDLAGAADTAASPEGALALPRFWLQRLPEGGKWEQLGRMSLQTIRMDDVRLDKTTLPESWASYTDLREVSLSGCALTGTLPASWGALSRLERVDVSDNLLGGGLPIEWSQLSRLRSLDVSLRDPGSAVSLVGELPSEWESLGRLRVLDLWNQGVSGKLPSAWSRMPALEVVMLSGTQVRGSLPHSWANMTNLTTLHLADTAISGKLPGSWGGMENLTWMDLRGTHISPGIPGAWRTKFCRAGSTEERPPAFAYFPWNGVTELNGVRQGDLNRCTVRRRRKRRKLALGLVILLAAAMWLAKMASGWLRRAVTARHVKLK